MTGEALHRKALAALSLCVGLTAYGCSNYGVMDVYNNTGQPIVLHLRRLHGDGHLEKDAPPGKHVGFYLPQLWSERGLDTLKFAIGRCEFVYYMPRMLEVIRAKDETFDTSYGLPIEAQVDPDLTIYLRPQSVKGMIPAARLRTLAFKGKRLQRGDFPMRPASRTCEPT